MATLVSSYVEQIQTTFETMRRRGLVVYDAASRGAAYVEKARRDLPKHMKDFQKNELMKGVYNDIFELKSLDAANKNRRNTLQELYFGIAVLAIAMCAGETTGVLWSASILSSVFDSSVELVLISILPVYAFFHLKECRAYDAIERRSWMFGLVYIISVLIGDMFGPRILSANPSLFFVPPFILAFLVGIGFNMFCLDVELSPNSVYSNRQTLLGVLMAGGFLVTQSLAVLSGTVTFAGMLVSLLHLVLIAVHFQIMEPRVEEESLGRNECQLLYIAGAMLVQLPLTLVFGSI